MKPFKTRGQGTVLDEKAHVCQAHLTSHASPSTSLLLGAQRSGWKTTAAVKAAPGVKPDCFAGMFLPDFMTEA